ncbi:MAG: NUDIX domain-containing protein [Chloroflexi bacterium]|nr:NUDIX domain-containing protein [Chloroflexota bacterium]
MLDQRPILRPSARVLLLDGQGRILLWRIADPADDVPSLWVTPGGALKPGESYEQAALRELWEETGLAGVALGPWVWRRRHVWRHGDRWYDSLERFFLVRAPAFPVAAPGLTPLERRVMKEHRWWSWEEVAAATETFVPRRLAELLQPLIAGRIPSEPRDTGA